MATDVAAVHSFGSIFLGQRGGVVGEWTAWCSNNPHAARACVHAASLACLQSQGALRINGSGFAWKRNSGGKAIEIKKDGAPNGVTMAHATARMLSPMHSLISPCPRGPLNHKRGLYACRY